jgi:pyridoxamine 5'-phosphate oxidase
VSDLADIRESYTKGTLDSHDLIDNPLDLFTKWLQQVIDSDMTDPTAMTIATVNNAGQPCQRIVLLKDVNADGFVFFTNLASRKAQELTDNPNISLHFPWYLMERQVRVCGMAEPLPRNVVDEYFLSRPKASQLAAWASKQSQPIDNREMLMARFNQLEQKFAHTDVPVPDFWGGYLVKPQQIEFWQGGEHRMHDRFEYNLDANGEWFSTRLMP